MKVAPCKGCPNRYPACHDKCEHYISWKQELNAAKQERLDNASFNDARSNSIAYLKVRYRYGDLHSRKKHCS